MSLVTIDKAPSWAVYRDLDLSWKPDENLSVAYILRDSQIKVEDGKETGFHRSAMKILTKEGLRVGSLMHAGFDSLSQVLVYHTINIHRDGQVIDQLDLDKIKVIDDEDELHRNIISGAKSTYIVLDDVRIGDVIEISHSVHKNTPYEGIMRVSPSDISTKDYYYSIMVPSSMDLAFKEFEGKWPPEETAAGGYKKLQWHRFDLKNRELEEGTPYLYEGIPWVQIALKQSWAEVSSELLQGMKCDIEPAKELSRFVDELVARFGDTRDAIVEILRFVQDEVRYHAESDSADSGYVAEDPNEVFEKRYGDCKGKVALAVIMLRRIGVSAHPFLVNSFMGSFITQILPSPRFNHVILKLEHEGKKYWFDVTQFSGAGDLDHKTQADDSYGLCLDGKSNTIEQVVNPLEDIPVYRLSESYTLDKNKKIALAYETTRVGQRADAWRQYMETVGKEDYFDELKQDFEQKYGEVEEGCSGVSEDDKDLNTIVYKANFNFKNPLTKNKDAKTYLLSVWLGILESLPEIPEGRVSPVAIDSNYCLEHVMRITTPGKHGVELTDEKIENSIFVANLTLKLEGHEILQVINLKYLKDTIDPEEFEQYNKDRQRLRDLAAWGWYIDEEAFGKSSFWSSWWVAGLVGYPLMKGIIKLVEYLSGNAQ